MRVRQPDSIAENPSDLASCEAGTAAALRPGMLARPRLDLHTLAVDFCLLVDEELASPESPMRVSLRQAARMTRENLAQMCRTVDETERMLAYERARDSCARATTTVDALHRAGALSHRRYGVAIALLGRIMERILDLTAPRDEEGRA